MLCGLHVLAASPEWCRLVPKPCCGVDVAVVLWGLAGPWCSLSEEVEVTACGVMPQLEWQGMRWDSSAGGAPLAGLC